MKRIINKNVFPDSKTCLNKKFFTINLNILLIAFNHIRTKINFVSTMNN